MKSPFKSFLLLPIKPSIQGRSYSVMWGKSLDEFNYFSVTSIFVLENRITIQ
ncbi:hypothetical protein EJD97_005443, partial [Solanum chilense]